MIIGLVGKKGSGKDTVGAYLVKEHGFERKAFADPLKKSVAALFDIPFSEVDKLKLDLTTGVAIGRQDSHNNIVPHSVMRPMTFREIVQRYGDESHRRIFGQGFWLDHTLPVAGYYAGRSIVITDCRFKNEADRVRHLGGYIVAVTRPQVDAGLADLHASETELEEIGFDYLLPNDGTIEQLYESIENMLGLVSDDA